MRLTRSSRQVGQHVNAKTHQQTKFGEVFFTLRCKTAVTFDHIYTYYMDTTNHLTLLCMRAQGKNYNWQIGSYTRDHLILLKVLAELILIWWFSYQTAKCIFLVIWYALLYTHTLGSSGMTTVSGAGVVKAGSRSWLTAA